MNRVPLVVLLAASALATGAATAAAKAPTISLQLPKGAVAGKTAKVSGRVSGHPVSGRRVALQKRGARGFATLVRGKVGRTGRFSVLLPPGVAGQEALRAVVTLHGRTLATSAVGKLMVTSAPPATTSAPAPVGPVPGGGSGTAPGGGGDTGTTGTTGASGVTGTTGPSGVPRSYAITYEGKAGYDFHRKNVYKEGGDTYTFTYEHDTSLDWTTPYAPIALGDGVAAASTPGNDALSGSGTSSDKSTGPGQGDDDDQCSGEDPVTDGGEDPPTVTSSKSGVAGDVHLDLQASNFAQYTTTCAVSKEKMVFIDSDEDSGYGGGGDDAMDVGIDVSYADLQNVTDATPLVIQVTSPQELSGHDCSDPSLNLPECESNLAWNGTITIRPAPAG